MGPTKDLGVDGLNAFFYQHHWNTVGYSLTKFFQEAFDTGSSPAKINSTLIVRILKVENPKNISSLDLFCNVIYKVITKVLANRMRKVLPKLIAKGQTSFAPDRSITENIIIT